MWEQLEIKRLDAEIERLKNDLDYRKKDYKFRCLELARQFSSNNDEMLSKAKELSEFIFS